MLPFAGQLCWHAAIWDKFILNTSKFAPNLWVKTMTDHFLEGFAPKISARMEAWKRNRISYDMLFDLSTDTLVGYQIHN